MGGRNEYRVWWEIDVQADNAVEAAEEALEIQRDSTSGAVVFDVRQHGSTFIEQVDLEEVEAMR